MSQENVDDFLEGAEALNRGNMERFLEGYDEDVVFEPRASQMEGTFVGPDGVKEFMTGLLDLFEFRTNFSDVRDLGNRVLAIGTQTTIARGSGIEQESPLAVVATYRNGLITHFKDYGKRSWPSKPPGYRSSCFGREAARGHRPRWIRARTPRRLAKRDPLGDTSSISLRSIGVLELPDLSDLALRCSHDQAAWLTSRLGWPSPLQRANG